VFLLISIGALEPVIVRKKTFEERAKAPPRLGYKGTQARE